MLEEATPQWINQQINARKHENQPVCVQVDVNADNARLALATPTCARRGGGGRPPNRLESEVIELWERRGLNDPNFSSGSVVAFLQQLKELL